jgi:predicted DNA-binding transcriptional regulator YafY
VGTINEILEVKSGMTIAFHYKNWQGISAVRTCEVIGFYYGQNEWHKENQFLLKGLDLEKNQERTFAIRDMSDLRILS